MEALRLLIYFVSGMAALQLLIHFLFRKRPVPPVFGMTVAVPVVLLWIMAAVRIFSGPGGGEIIFACLWSIAAMICALVTLFIRLLCGWLVMAAVTVRNRCHRRGHPDSAG